MVEHCLVLQAIDSKVREEVDEATAQALADAWPPQSGLWTDVYSQCLESKIRGVGEFNMTHVHENRGVNH